MKTTYAHVQVTLRIAVDHKSSVTAEGVRVMLEALEVTATVKGGDVLATDIIEVDSVDLLDDDGNLPEACEGEE